MSQEPEEFPLRIFTVESEPPNDSIDDEPLAAGWIGEPPTMEALQEAFEAFAAGNVAAVHVQALSDLDMTRAAYVRTHWPDLADEVRAMITSSASTIGDENVGFDFRRFLTIAMEDAAPMVRQFAVAGFASFADEASAEILLSHFTQDASPDVRAEAAGSLAWFVDSLDYTPAGLALEARIRDTLLKYTAQPGEAQLVRAAALETVSLYGNNAQLQQLIDEFYAEDETGLRLSAVIAMGNSCDKRWSSILTTELFSTDNQLRWAAATALGHLEDPDALPDLQKATRDADIDVRHAAILAIGSIPGPASQRILTKLAEDPLEEDVEVIDEALMTERIFGMDPLSDDFDEEDLPY